MSNDNIPRALYDNLNWLTEPTSKWHCNYLQNLDVSDAEKEFNLAKKFLLSYEGSLDTFTSYRREVERLCQWSWLVNRTSIKLIDRTGIIKYFDFVQKPPKDWVSEKHSHRFETNPQGERVPLNSWRPFLLRKSNSSFKAQAMSQGSLRAVISCVSTFFTFLQQEKYLLQNPVLLLRQKNRYIQNQQQKRITRKLTNVQWNTLIIVLRDKCKENSRFERHLFIFSAFFLLGLRISELADESSRSAMMGDFFKDGNNLWWFQTVGKGNKRREVAVPDSMLEALIRYRKSLDLSSLPFPNDSTPLIPKIKGNGGIGVRQLRKMVQEGFNFAIASLKKKGHTTDANNLSFATVHWLRHTSISHDVTFRPREHVRDDAGHQSVSVTDRYIEIDLQARHKSAKGKDLFIDSKIESDDGIQS